MSFLPVNPRALRELTLSRVRVMLREPEVVFWVFLFPVLLALGLGVAFGDPAPEAVRIVVERGSAAEAFAEALEARDDLSVRVLDPDAAADALRRGEAALVLGAAPRRGNADDGGVPVLRYDPTRPEGRMARLTVDAALQAAAGAPRLVAVEIDALRRPGSRYIDWLIPGLVGFNLMSTGLWAVGFYVTSARSTRQLKRLVATPMRRSDFLLAQVLARFAFLVAEVPILILFAWLVFGVEVRGGAGALAVVVLLGAACFVGFGLLAGSRARTTEGVSGIINVIVMPMLVLSGVFFSPARFPEGAQPFIQLLPLTALNDALRGVYNDGASLLALGPELAIVSAWTLATFLLALKLFRWQ